MTNRSGTLFVCFFARFIFLFLVRVNESDGEVVGYFRVRRRVLRRIEFSLAACDPHQNFGSTYFSRLNVV